MSAPAVSCVSGAVPTRNAKLHSRRRNTSARVHMHAHCTQSSRRNDRDLTHAPRFPAGSTLLSPVRIEIIIQWNESRISWVSRSGYLYVLQLRSIHSVYVRTYLRINSIWRREKKRANRMRDACTGGYDHSPSVLQLAPIN